MHYVTRAGEKLRKEGLMAQTLMVFAHSNPFREQDMQYSASQVIPMAMPTADTRKLIRAALTGLEKIYRPGIKYKKSGIPLSELIAPQDSQSDFFGESDSDSRQQLMATLDLINVRYGRRSVFMAGAGSKHSAWHMRTELKSPSYLTEWQQICTASA